MRNTFYFSFPLLSLLLSSCIVGTTLSVINKTKTEKHIDAIYPQTASYPTWMKRTIGDSLRGYDISQTEGAVTSRDFFRYPVLIPISSGDTLTRTYSFTLKPGYLVRLMEQYPSLNPALGQVFIIDQKDTIVLDRSGRYFRKRPKWGKGGGWTYTIRDTP